jgi:hypothetical protein
MISHFDDQYSDEIPEEAQHLGISYATSYGFAGILFKDSYGEPSYIQMSSVCDGYPPGQSALWIGKEKQAMHLNKDQVVALVLELDSWLREGIFLHQKEEAR